MQATLTDTDWVIESPLAAVDPVALAGGLWASAKLDGIGCIVAPRRPPLTRKFTPLPNRRLAELVAPLQAIADHNGWSFRGEMYSAAVPFEAIQSAVMSRGKPLPAGLKVHVFNALPAAGGWVPTLAERYAWLRRFPALAGVEIVEQVAVSDAAALASVFAAELAAGGEGIVLADPAAAEGFEATVLYRLKPVETFDAEIVAVVEGAGRFASMAGAAVVGMADGSSRRVGCGFSRAQRAAMWADPSAFVGRWLEFYATVKAGRIRTPPVFLRWRASDSAGKV